MLSKNSHPIAPINNLENYLNEKEAMYTDITPGAEKKIVWHDSDAKTRTQYSIVYLHGFSATRQEIAPVTEILAKNFQANLFLTRLTGHGRSSDAMLEISVEKLLADATEALEIGKTLGDNLIIIANSTGATLATYLAMQDKQNIYALILLSPNFGLKRKTTELLQLPWPEFTVNILQGSIYEFTPSNPMQAKYWTCQFPSKALIPMMHLLKKIRNMSLEKISQPVFVLYCPLEQVIDVRAILKYTRRFKSTPFAIDTITPQGNRKHVLAGDILSPATTQQVVEKIQSFIASIGVKHPVDLQLSKS